MGVEPTRPNGQGILSPQRLPFRHSAKHGKITQFRRFCKLFLKHLLFQDLKGLRAYNKMTLYSSVLFSIRTASGCIDNAIHCLLRLPCRTKKRSLSVQQFILLEALNGHGLELLLEKKKRSNLTVFLSLKTRYKSTNKICHSFQCLKYANLPPDCFQLRVVAIYLHGFVYSLCRIRDLAHCKINKS